jgi:thiol:disulfide interchange protein DsbD
MKKLFTLLLAVATVSLASAQGLDPVSWSFSSKKINATEYEVQLIASIEPGWHLYSQSQPDDAIALPTVINFVKNPLLSLDGKVKEEGRLIKYKDDALDVSANQYSNKVVFVQKVKVKGKAKTAVKGSLEYQTCDDKKCLPPKTVKFSVALK